jgi:hypothetical protein
MKHGRARTFAVCAVKLDEDHMDAAEGTFDAALTNALVAIVASEWPGEEKRKPNKPHTKAASELLELIRKKGEEDEGVVGPAPGEHDVFLIRDHAGGVSEDDVEERPVAEASGEEPTDGLFDWTPPTVGPWGTRVDVGTLLDAVLNITQPVRHAREDEDNAERRLLERRHIDALLALDDHPSLWALDMEREDHYEHSARKQNGREMERAARTLERIGDEEAERRAKAAADLHTGPTPDDLGALELQDCPVCGFEAFSSDGEDDLCMQVGPGECLVCHYRRSPAIANAIGRDMWWEARGDRD